MATPVQSKSEKTRQHIIERTATIFNAKGYVGTTMNDLTEATGLTKGSIYGNFENKDEVALAVFDYNFGKISALIVEKIKSRDSSISKLLVYPETYRNFFKIPFLEAGCPLLNTAMDADDTHPQLRDRAHNALKRWRSSVEKIITVGIESGEIKKNVDVPVFVTILISLIEGGIMQAKLAGKQDDLTTTMNHLEKLILDLKK